MNHDEDKIQSDIVSLISGMGIYIFAVPNSAAGKCSPQRAARLKATGLRAGVADLVIAGNDGKIYFMEVKTLKGKLLESQKNFMRICKERSWPYAVVRSAQDALACIKAWGLTN